MKKLLLIGLLCLCAPLVQAKDVGMTITTASTDGTVTRGARGLTFLFSSDFAGTVAGATFAGARRHRIFAVDPDRRHVLGD